MTGEKWTPVVGYEKRYEVSSQGRVRALFHHPSFPAPPRIIKATRKETGYYVVGLYDTSKKCRMFYLHRVVLRSFRGEPPHGHNADHVNFNKSDNRLANLRWLPAKDNRGRGYDQRGFNNHQAKLTPKQVRKIRTLYSTGRYTQKQLKLLFGVGQATVNGIVRHLTWTNV